MINSDRRWEVASGWEIKNTQGEIISHRWKMFRIENESRVAIFKGGYFFSYSSVKMVRIKTGEDGSFEMC